MPDGPDETANVVVRTGRGARAGSISPPGRTGSWAPALGILDFERGVKITGSRFYVLSGAGRACSGR